jgi:hypothetical protein
LVALQTRVARDAHLSSIWPGGQQYYPASMGEEIRKMQD